MHYPCQRCYQCDRSSLYVSSVFMDTRLKPSLSMLHMGAKASGSLRVFLDHSSQFLSLFLRSEYRDSWKSLLASTSYCIFLPFWLSAEASWSFSGATYPRRMLHRKLLGRKATIKDDQPYSQIDILLKSSWATLGSSEKHFFKRVSPSALFQLNSQAWISVLLPRLLSTYASFLRWLIVSL